MTKANYIGGRIQTVDPASGDVKDLYTECDGRPLLAPNDLVFDAHGGFYFTDHGVVDDEERVHKIAGIYYARADGSGIREVVYPSDDPNGIGLSPDGTKLYWAETWRGRILQRDVVAPGEVAEPGLVDQSQCLYGFPGLQLLDSLAVDSAGNVCVATIVNGGVSVISPAGELVEFVATGDLITTNICFGGDDLTTAYITLSTTGRLVKMAWPRPGLALEHLNR
jgi:gluconolactonase